ncbi:Cmx/CmrA family chloramphenicol efflux MFS transporter [Nocardia brasiliensis]|uniref:Cmx/CmrA family chloramphenicol efflux MFS transporter n=1 Tax=Nocardia brasiliensis TaxID=37326 RepID=UPI002454290D|nr:Cmx/CmrA family chloramphenicol efflux MFS transporter [Nocardia brasiliensis]
MPILVWVMGVAVFAQGTSEFMLSGLLEPIAQDVGVSLGAAGALTSLFAVGMIVGAPLMAMTAGRWPVRSALTGFLALFIGAHAVGALTANFIVLLATRAVAAVAYAGFLSVALASLPALVGAARVGRATAIILSGVTLACILGVPAGAFLGQTWGWRSAFWAVVAASVPALVALWGLVRVPVDRVTTAEGRVIRREWQAITERPVRVVLIAGALVNAATFASFTYLAVLATEVGGAGKAWVPVILALFGLGSFLGVSLGGRYADRHATPLVTIGSAALIFAWATTGLTAQYLPVLLIMTTVCGAVSFAVGSTLIGLIVSAATPTAPRMSGAFATATFNIGAAAGPAVAGIAITSTGTPSAAVWTSAVISCAATAVTLIGRRPQHRTVDGVSAPSSATPPRSRRTGQ